MNISLPLCPTCQSSTRVADGFPLKMGYYVCHQCGDSWRKPTTIQEELFEDYEVHGIDEARYSTVPERFLAFNARNPKVYAHIVRLARAALARGRVQQGVAMHWELLRWNSILTTMDPSSDLKLCNDYRAYYSRLIQVKESDLEGVFRTRALTTPGGVEFEAMLRAGTL